MIMKTVAFILNDTGREKGDFWAEELYDLICFRIILAAVLRVGCKEIIEPVRRLLQEFR